MNGKKTGLLAEVLERVPCNFNIEKYMKERGEREREIQEVLEKEFGKKLPLGVFDPPLVFVGVKILQDLREKSPVAFSALIKKLQNPAYEIDEESRRDIDGVKNYGLPIFAADEEQERINVLFVSVFEEALRSGGKLLTAFLGRSGE